MPAATPEEISRLVGRWVGEGLNDEAEDAIGEGAAYFDGLSYVLGGKGQLRIGVRIAQVQFAYVHHRTVD